MHISRDKIIDFFSMLNRLDVRYVLLRNIDNELPDSLNDEKDIDVLINHGDRDLFRSILRKNGWRQVRHPWDFGNNFVFLYSMNPLEFYEKDGMHLDICYQLCCRSVNNGEWMPLDKKINASVWQNRKISDDGFWYELSDDDLFIHLLTRCIFDKKQFKKGYIEKIKELYNVIDMDDVMEKLNLVFFKFTGTLLKLIENEEYDCICKKYETYSAY